MRVATFNLESLDAPVAPRARLLRPALERLDADILCLQEVNGQKVGGRRMLAALDELLLGTPYAGFHRASTRFGKGVADVHNLVTLSRFPIVGGIRKGARQRRILPCASRGFLRRSIGMMERVIKDGAHAGTISWDLSHQPTSRPGCRSAAAFWSGSADLVVEEALRVALAAELALGHGQVQICSAERPVTIGAPVIALHLHWAAFRPNRAGV
jgi:hypothetical protein